MQDQPEDLFIYGNNTGEGTTLSVYLKRRPTFSSELNFVETGQKDKVSVSLTLQDDQEGAIYTLDETEVVLFSEHEYRAAGFAYEALQGNKIGRIKYRGYLQRQMKGEKLLVYVEIRFLVLYFSKTYDHQRQFDDDYLLKQLKKWPKDQIENVTSISDILEDKLEQFCQIKGTFKVESEKEKELFFLGSVGRRLYSVSNDSKSVHLLPRKVMKICGFDVEGNGFQVGVVNFPFPSKLPKSAESEFVYGFTSRQGNNFDLLTKLEQVGQTPISEMFVSILKI